MQKQLVNGGVKPIVVKDTPKDHAAEILTKLRQLEPEEQNRVIDTILREITIDRIDKARSAADERDRHGKLAEEFISAMNHERYAKEYEANGQNKR